MGSKMRWTKVRDSTVFLDPEQVLVNLLVSGSKNLENNRCIR